MQWIHDPKCAAHAAGAESPGWHVGPDGDHTAIAQTHDEGACDQPRVVLHQQQDQQAAAQESADQIAAALNTQPVHQMTGECFATERAHGNDGVEQGGRLAGDAQIFCVQAEVGEHAQGDGE